jgi:hypothetical protein
MNRRHMTGDHHGWMAGRATLLVRAVDEILGTHNTRWQWRRDGSARYGGLTSSRRRFLVTATPISSYFITNNMGTGYAATPPTRAVMPTSSARRMTSQRDVPRYAGPRCETRRKGPAQRRPPKILISASLSQPGSILGRENRR